MPRFRTIAELQELRRRLRDQAHQPQSRVTVCAGTACQASGANDVQRICKRLLMERDLVDRLGLRITGCHGFCEMGPFIVTEPQGAFYPKVDTAEIPAILEAACSGDYADVHFYRDPVTGDPVPRIADITFFAKQRRVLLGKNQRLDPIRLFDYIADGGYDALVKVLTDYTPERVIEEVRRSGLRGRGGAGFPTAAKWDRARRQNGARGKFVVCNADEGDPGAYMDRSILEGNPHSIIEGMIIGAIAIGATEGFVFVRHEYPLAIKHVLIALRLAREFGLLGKDILGTGLDFDIQIVKSAGAFVCGEETALIRTIEGTVGEPRQRPPFPTERGIGDRPTCINNVETWANVPIVLAEGADAYARVGTATSTGTKVFSVVGRIRNTGLIEVPMGTSINEIVYDIGGGPLDGGTIKAVQIGGPSGGCIPHWRFDLPIDYDSLRQAGAIMGSGGMIVMDESTCMVDVARYFMGFLKDESCGKCFTCRKGTQRMWEILDEISKGIGTLDQLNLLEELGRTVSDSSMCGLGQAAPNPVLSTLRYFRREYERHVVDKRCDAHVCKALTGAPCQAACPVGTEAWRYAALIARGEYEEAYRVIRASNPFPSVCARVCDHRCERWCRLRTTGDDPLSLRALKRFVTDRIDPGAFEPARQTDPGADGKRVAIVGSGPAGLTAAHYLSVSGYATTVFESEDRPGGLLTSGIPAFRLPRDIVQREIDALIDQNVTLRCGRTLGRDFTIAGLLEQGFDAVFLAAGAHQSWRMRIPGEDLAGVYPSMEFLKAWNLRGKPLATGRVGIVGGGNSAVDAARVAIRHPMVTDVTILYRRTREEMPAFREEIEETLDEGVKLQQLVSPIRLHGESGRMTAVELVRNQLGERDSSGRRQPVAEPGSAYRFPLDTLVVAISEAPSEVGAGHTHGLELRDGAVVVDERTLATSLPGVFAGGDITTGPSTVIDAIAAGKRAAAVIRRYLQRLDLSVPIDVRTPVTYVEPIEQSQAAADRTPRVAVPTLPAATRIEHSAEVQGSLQPEDAAREAARCLRCDLEFTRIAQTTTGRKTAAGA